MAGEDEQRIPRLAPGWEEAGRSLSPAEGFLLSRIDGRTSWTLLCEIGGLPPDEVERCLERWLSEGVIVTEGESAPRTRPRSARISENEVDTELEIPVDLQRRILEFERTLERPYHELLGVARNAEPADIKRAYFALSKIYHPDRYYRRNLGPFKERLKRIFRTLVEACELLCDPATRSEVQRSLGQTPASAGGNATPEPPTPQGYRIPSRRERLDRLRRQFRIPEPVLAERRFKARQFFQAAQMSAGREKWLEAAASARLAIAFDPWNDAYKQGFAEIQANVHQVRAVELLQRAQASMDDSAAQEAMRLLEEALSYRPTDPQANAHAAEVALELGDADSAREYAEAAREFEPDNGSHHRLVARTYRRLGLRDKARKSLEEALRIDPKDEAAQKDLDSLRRPARRRA